MANTIKFNESNCAVLASFSPTNIPRFTTHAIASLAASKTCGLAILVDKLLVNSSNNDSVKYLINNLIHRFHQQSIRVAVSSGDNPEDYISQIIEKAVEYTLSENMNRTSVNIAAKLLTRAVIEFESNQVDFQTLEHNWKEFIFHFYRSKINNAA
jgi:hypothetical protein